MSQRGFVVDGYFAERHMQFYFSSKRKKLALDSVEQTTAREYLQIGRLMYFETADIEIVRGSAEARRRFLDFVAAQKDAAYRKALRDYERALRSRNALLKGPSPRWPQIDAFNEPLLAAGEELTRGRKQLVTDLQPQCGRRASCDQHGAGDLGVGLPRAGLGRILPRRWRGRAPRMPGFGRRRWALIATMWPS